MVSEIAYREFVDCLVQKALAQRMSWPALVAALPGVHPSTIHETVVRLGLRDMVSPSFGPTPRTEAATTVARLWGEGLLPTPHLLDSSWWFADSALDSLLRRVCQYSTDGEPVLLLGTPTLLQAAHQSSIGRNFTLVDREPAVSRSGSMNGQMIRADIVLNQPRLADSPRVVVVDPPWYVAETRSFLWMARRNAGRNTRILLSTPPIGTRPGIEEDWTSLISWCAQIGLQLEDYLPSELAYVTPPFEENAIRAAGVPECPLSWRRGDLAVFVCLQDRVCPEPVVPNTQPWHWHDISIGRVRVRIRRGEATSWSSLALHECVKGAVLPSVSRRIAGLGSVRIWTSGNRVFTCQNAAAIRWIAEALAAKNNPATVVRKQMGACTSGNWTSQVEKAAGKLEAIIGVEEEELSCWEQRLNE